MLDDRRRLVEIIHTNKFQEECVRDKNRSISYVVLRTNRVQNSVSDFTKHETHNCQNVEIDDYVNFILVVLIIDVRMMFFIVIVVVFSSAFAIFIVFFSRRIDRDLA